MWCVGQNVGVAAFRGGIPGPSTREMGVLERHHVVNIQLACSRYGRVGKGPPPLAGCDLAALRGFESDRDLAFSDEDFVAGVLTVAIVVSPVSPVGTVVRREI